MMHGRYNWKIKHEVELHHESTEALMGLLSWFKKEKPAKEDLIDFESMYEGVDELGVRGYKLSHLETCKRIWHNYVPESGQSDCIQGELLRQLEGLRNEAQGNGNINWDDNFEFFCNFI